MVILLFAIRKLCM